MAPSTVDTPSEPEQSAVSEKVKAEIDQLLKKSEQKVSQDLGAQTLADKCTHALAIPI